MGFTFGSWFCLKPVQAASQGLGGKAYTGLHGTEGQPQLHRKLRLGASLVVHGAQDLRLSLGQGLDLRANRTTALAQLATGFGGGRVGADPINAAQQVIPVKEALTRKVMDADTASIFDENQLLALFDWHTECDISIYGDTLIILESNLLTLLNDERLVSDSKSRSAFWL